MKKLFFIFSFMLISIFSYSEDLLINNTEELNIQNNEKKEISVINRVSFLLDIDGTFNDEESFTLNDSFGGEILLERAYRMNTQIELGFGAAAQSNGKITTDTGTLTGFYSVPVYAMAKYNVIGGALYVKARLGLPVVVSDSNLQNYLSDSVSIVDSSSIKLDGLFYGGLGVGLDYGIYEWEMAYSYNSMDYEYKENGVTSNKSLENIRVSLGFSKKF